jgi:Tfp pilus assembly protein PilO
MIRKTVVIATLAATAAAYMLLIAPLAERRAELKERLQSSYFTLIKNEEFILRTQKAGIKMKDALKELEEMEQYIIHADDMSLGFATLQSRIQDIAMSSGMTITSIKPLTAVSYKGYRGLPIYMEGVLGIKELSRFLNQLDSTWDFISIDSLIVSTTAKDMLKIKIQLSGLLKA